MITPGLFFKAGVAAWDSEPQQEQHKGHVGLQILEAGCSDECRRARGETAAVFLVLLSCLESYNSLDQKVS